MYMLSEKFFDTQLNANSSLLVELVVLFTRSNEPSEIAPTLGCCCRESQRLTWELDPTYDKLAIEIQRLSM
jgi:hypothetical protein